MLASSAAKIRHVGSSTDSLLGALLPLKKECHVMVVLTAKCGGDDVTGVGGLFAKQRLIKSGLKRSHKRLTPSAIWIPTGLLNLRQHRLLLSE